MCMCQSVTLCVCVYLCVCVHVCVPECLCHSVQVQAIPSVEYLHCSYWQSMKLICVSEQLEVENQASKKLVQDCQF